MVPPKGAGQSVWDEGNKFRQTIAWHCSRSNSQTYKWGIYEVR